MSNKLNLVAISDLHGYLPTDIKPSDIMLIAGDISPLDMQFNKPKMKKWVENEFAEWVNSLPVEKVYLIAGNHDGYFSGINPMNLSELKVKCNFKLIYLENSWCVHRHNGYEFKIFGTPYCHIFGGGWPFMVSDEYMKELFKEIPDVVDIIISHDPPFGVGDVDVVLNNPRHRGMGEHLGNKPLRKRLEEIKFSLLVSGHIHSGQKQLVSFNGGQCVNVSIKDERYNPTYEPFYYGL